MSHLTNPTTQANAKVLRQNMTEAEKKLWQRIRNNQLGVKFRKQVPIGGYVVDFYSYAYRLAIEIDGSHHQENDQLAYDIVRTDYLNSLGIQVIRYDNHSVLTNLEGVLADIQQYVQQYNPSPNPSLGEGSGFHFLQ